MAVSRRGVQKFKEWIALLKEQGWSAEDQKYLADYWWKHHDDDGKIFPPGVTRQDGDTGRE